ncbi:tyrosine-type recombinase/integrase [Cardinium endosymbiont of Culicoides punctatus]|uniref:tyrosine-type recombinase/integrase n=1 Tax=Cardinium endosymbiont of Culicoides punctatus TaxID=2304601 RepID=UPI00105915BC|nr:tyrosine-type recombinase/integrase [Cardinium endosymbiont of Culicoides punctatus]TDG94098.1 hypothetical protein CCPUN_08500 [Cardinium endosymbiont of Culicoides punctatus]
MIQSDFTSYLVKQGFVAKTIQRHSSYANYYINWLTTNNIHLEEATYKDLINYISYLQQIKSKQVINDYLRSISHYYRWLNLPNIAYQVRITGIEKQQQVLFTEEELDHIYHTYTSQNKKSFFRYSDKILLGLSVYQALDASDIIRLEIQHLNFNTGKLFVPGGVKTKISRTLKLEAHQILQIHDYMENHRDKRTEKFISPEATNENQFYHQIKNLNRQMRSHGVSLQMDIRRLKQFRQSRITLWIKQYGLRKTQYYAGFKHVSSVEHYRKQDSEDLREYVLQFHPLQ